MVDYVTMLKIVHKDLEDLDEKAVRSKNNIWKLNKARDHDDVDIKALLTRVTSLEERLTKAEKEIKEQDGAIVILSVERGKTNCFLSSTRPSGWNHREPTDTGGKG